MPHDLGSLPLNTFVEDRYKTDDYDILYSGASGIMMKASHRLIERGIMPKSNVRVLEVGGGGMPHFYWMNSASMQSYAVFDKIKVHEKKMEALKKALPPQIRLSLHDFDDDLSLDSVEGNFTRIIASHVLEHIRDPERAIVKWLSLLSSDGILSIAVPCDPGWLWRLGQTFAFKGYKTSLTFQEYDLLMSREHINSVQRILKILRYYCRALEIRWFPFAVPVVDFNLICAINLKTSNIRLP